MYIESVSHGKIFRICVVFPFHPLHIFIEYLICIGEGVSNARSFKYIDGVETRVEILASSVLTSSRSDSSSVCENSTSFSENFPGDFGGVPSD